MSGFRKSQNIIRQTPGGYVNGIWVNGVDALVVISGSIQPLNGVDIKLTNLPQGRVLKDIVKIYTNDELISMEDKGEDQQPDKLVWRGVTYEVSSRFDWQSDVISHFKYFATKVQLNANI